jgi:hypothetical protein
MAEVEQGKVEQVENEKHLSRPEESPDPEKDEGSAEEVVLLTAVVRMANSFPV